MIPKLLGRNESPFSVKGFKLLLLFLPDLSQNCATLLIEVEFIFSFIIAEFRVDGDIDRKFVCCMGLLS